MVLAINVMKWSEMWLCKRISVSLLSKFKGTLILQRLVQYFLFIYTDVHVLFTDQHLGH